MEFTQEALDAAMQDRDDWKRNAEMHNRDLKLALEGGEALLMRIATLEQIIEDIDFENDWRDNLDLLERVKKISPTTGVDWEKRIKSEIKEAAARVADRLGLQWGLLRSVKMTNYSEAAEKIAQAIREMP